MLWQSDRKHKDTLCALGCPRTVPWAFIEQWRDGCHRNHDQSPERLAERGGLAPEEIVALSAVDSAERRRLWYAPPEESVPRLLEMLAVWNTGPEVLARPGDR